MTTRHQPFRPRSTTTPSRQVLEQLAPVPPDAKLLVDARHTRWASPYGLTALLTLAQTRAERPALAVARARGDGVVLGAHRLLPARRGAVRAARHRASRARERRVERAARDHARRQERGRARGRRPHPAEGAAILVKELNLDAKATMGFAMTLSRGLPEHRRARGARRLGGRADLPLAEAARPPRRRDRGVRRGRRLSAVARERAGARRRAIAGTTARRSRKR